MNKRLCVYTIILVVLLIVSLFISKNESNTGIEWFNFGKKQILSLKYESQYLDVEIVKQDITPSKQRLEDLKNLKDKGIYFLKYTTKNIDTNKKEPSTNSIVLQCNYDLNKYLYFYSPFVVDKSFESNDLEAFGINELSPKISIQYEDITKTILVGNHKNDDELAYYYDPEKKMIFIHKDSLTGILREALKTLVSYNFSDVQAKDVSYIKVESSEKEKTLYKVTTVKDSNEFPSWSLTQQGEPDDYIVKWIDYLMSVKVERYLDIKDEDTENVISISMFNSKDNLIESIKLSKYQDSYVGKTNYTHSWVSIGKQDVEKIIDQFNKM